MTIMDDIPYLNLTETESTTLQIMQGVLSGIAMVLNVLYLIVIKTNNERLNATEVLQTCKTVLVLLALIIYMPLEIIVVHGMKRNNLSICLLKDLMERLLLDSYPFVIMAVAITRFRVSICKGNSAVLITTTSALATFAICLLPTFISGGFTLVLYLYQHGNTIAHQEGQSFYECRTYFNSMVITYNEVVLITFGVIPVLVTICTYYIIYYKVSATRSRSKVSILPQRHSRCKRFSNNTHDSNIKTTMILLITVFTLAWFMYIFLAIFNMHSPMKTVSFCLILSKPLIYLIHPLAEGLLLRHKRYKIGTFFAEIIHCKPKEPKEEASGVEVQIDSSCIRHPSVGQYLGSVKEENIARISMSPDCQKRYSTSDVSLKEELFNEGLAPSACLYTRRTGHPMPPLVSIIEDNGNSSLSPHSPVFRKIRYSRERGVSLIPSSREGVSLISSPQGDVSLIPSPQKHILHCAAVPASPTIGDRIGVALSANTIITPPSCLKKNRRSSCASCYLGKTPSPGHVLPIKKGYIRTSPASVKRLSAKNTVRFKFSSSSKDIFDHQESQTMRPNLISSHF